MAEDKSRTYHHPDLRTALISEAAQMIADEGVGGLTMRALGQRLGVSRSAAYRHFQDKSSVLLAVAVSGFERLTTRIEKLGTIHKSSDLAFLRRIGEEYVQFAIENPAHYSLMYGRESLPRSEQPVLREAASTLFDQIVKVIQIHQRHGVLKRQEPKTQAYIAWSALHGLASLLIEKQIMGPVDVDSLIRQTTKTVLDGMRKASSS